MIFAPDSVNAARCASFIQHKSLTNCGAHLTESNYSTRPRCITEKRDIQKLINNFVILLQAFENEESAQLTMELEKIQNELVPILPMINKKKGRNKDEILAQMQMKQVLKQCREQLNGDVNDLLNTIRATAIQKLVDKRIISIYDYSYNSFSLDELTGGFFANLLGTIKQGKSYPLFDKISADGAFVG